MTDWNAERYHEISAPQQAWGRRVLERLTLEGGERVLDVGCGTGHLTALLAARLPRGFLVGTDRSGAMLDTARTWLLEHAPATRLVRADAAGLPFQRAFDVIFSAATFHWITDHGALFRSLVTALRPGGRLVAQCGGGPNLARLLARTRRLMAERRFASYFDGWTDPWYFADVETTRRLLESVGFAAIDVSLEEAPVSFDSARAFADFIATVCVRHHLDRLPSSERGPFVFELTREGADDDPPLTLDYWRLNIDARRPAS